jgi:peptide/nickel transport system permease protein
MQPAEGLEPTSAAAAELRTAQRAERLHDVGKRRTYLGMAWRRFRHNKLSMTGAVILLVMILLALNAGLISKYVTHHTPEEQNLRAAYLPIFSPDYILGSDNLGRDTMTRLLYGARMSFGIAGLSIVMALTFGAVVGLLAGYYGGWLDSLLMRFVDIMLCIPTLFLLLLVATMWQLGPWTLALLIAAVAWVTLSRLVRGEVISIRNRDYVDAATVVGASQRRIIFRHILPNAAPIMIVWASLTIPALILTEAALSFLGLGVQPPTPTWGNMLSSAQQFWSQSVALVILPGMAIYITVFAINLMGNGLRDALDPRLTD